MAPVTPTKKDKKEKSSSSSSKTKTKGLSQKKNLLQYLKYDPSMKRIVPQKIMDKQRHSDDDTVSSASSFTPPKPEDLQDSQDPYDL